MTIAGSLPPASIFGDWHEDLLVVDSATDEPFDLSAITEIRLLLRRDGFNDLTLTMSGGNIVVAAPGLIEWHVPVGQMRTLCGRLYDVVMQFEDGTNTWPLFLGTVSVIGDEA